MQIAISTNRSSGGHAPSFMYRIIADHYRAEDTDLESEHMIVTSAD